MHVKISRLHDKLKYVTSKLIEEMERRKKMYERIGKETSHRTSAKKENNVLVEINSSIL